MKWKTEKLADLLENLESGGRPRGGASLDSGGVPSLGGEHIGSDGEPILNAMKFIPRSYYESLNQGRIKKGDILIVKDGATTGKTAFVGENFPYEDAAVNEHVFIVRVNRNRLVPKFAFYWLFSPRGNRQVLSDFRGSAQGGISRSFVNQVRIPLPPLEEQRRIVEILDEADRLRKLRRQADAIAERILPAMFYKMFGDPVRNEKGWETTRLDEISEIVTGNTPSREHPQYFGSDIPWARPADLDGQLPVIKTEQGLSREGALVGRVVPENSILVCCIGATLGKVGLAGVEMAINQQINALLPTEKATPEFLYVMCLLMREVFRATATQQTLPILNKSRFGQQKGILPPIQLQEQFSQRARELIDQYRQRELSTTTVEKLFNSLLHHTFTGELTKRFIINNNAGLS